jgi:hypothetical protein
MRFANNLPPLARSQGLSKAQRAPVRLTRVRVLDILLWTEVAIYGRSPHSEWLAAHRAAYGEPRPVDPGARARQRTGLELPEVVGVAVFKDDDAGYLSLLKMQADRVVLNCERTPRAGYLIVQGHVLDHHGPPSPWQFVDWSVPQSARRV